ncbi:MAG TPA: antitoxin Xre/MbcA/ParS toxin-binding domain-containing protein [Chryseolinea sp.]|nr:antitoxin Xre/MbcA/ParS toxin-binding domain-containing protein [Chryseolinea sp.]
MAKQTKPVGARSKRGSSEPRKSGVYRSAKSGKFTEHRTPEANVVKEKTVIYASSIARKVKASVRTDHPERKVVHVIILTDRPEFELTPIEKMQMVERGISKNALQKLKDKSGLDYDQLSQLLNVSRTTLIGKKGNTKFNTDISDKILGLADIYSYGYEVFEDRDRFNEWIFRPNNALGGQSPFELLHNSFGKEEVKNLIGRIDYGIYS